jgi:hypothetical protein
MTDFTRSPIYLEFIRGRVCSFCFSTVVEPHHVFRTFRGIGGGGISRKGSDFLTVPCCRNCHQNIHSGHLRADRVEFLELIVINLVCFVVKSLSSDSRQRGDREAEKIPINQEP